MTNLTLEPEPVPNIEHEPAAATKPAVWVCACNDCEALAEQAGAEQEQAEEEQQIPRSPSPTKPEGKKQD